MLKGAAAPDLPAERPAPALPGSGEGEDWRPPPASDRQIAYVGLVVVLALVTGVAAYRLDPPEGRDLVPLAVLGALGFFSGAVRSGRADSDTDLSFTGVVLLAAAPLVGAFGAAVLGAVIPILEFLAFGRRLPQPRTAVVFNAAMTSLCAAGAAAVYELVGGWSPLVAGSGVEHHVLDVGLPLLVADVTLCGLNGAVLAGVIAASGGDAWSFFTGPFRRALPLYLGYAVTAFMFVILWGPAEVGPFSAVLIMAPLFVARWVYLQYVDEGHARERILETLATASGGRENLGLRAARLHHLTRLIQGELSLTARERLSVRIGAALHDIGLVAVPRTVLDRRGGDLDDAALAAVTAHAEVGYEIVRDVEFLADAALAVRHHHERMDGRGYPAGLCGRDIPVAARVLAVADAYEARAWADSECGPGDHDAAMAQVHAAAGAHLDPRIVVAFERAMAGGRPEDPVLDGRLEPEDVSGLPGTGAVARPPLRHAAAAFSAMVAARLGPGLAGLPGRTGRTGPDTDRAPVAHGSTRAERPRGHGIRVRRAWRPVDTWRAVAGTVLLLLPLLLLLWPAPWSRWDPWPGAHGPTIVLYLLLLVVAERFRVRRRGRLEVVPMAVAVGLSMALTTRLPQVPDVGLTTGIVVVVVLYAQLVDWLTVRWYAAAGERDTVAFDGAVRLVVITLVSVVVRDLPLAAGRPLEDVLGGWPGWQQAFVMSLVVVLVLLLEVPVRAWWRARLDRAGVVSVLPEQLRGSLGLGAAMAATGVLVAMAEAVLGLVAVPLLLLPLVITQLAVRQHEKTRFAYLQSIRALSRLPEVAGLVPRGHAARVTELSVAVGRRLGMTERAVGDLEHAALLHDIGQLSLRRPIPSGATVLAAPGDQERIAALGADIVALAGPLAEVSTTLAGQAVPYRHVVRGRRRLPLPSRIIKAVNAYDDYLGTGPQFGSPEERRGSALERLYLGLGHEYDPKVVRAIDEVLARHPGADAARCRWAVPLRPPGLRRPARRKS